MQTAPPSQAPFKWAGLARRVPCCTETETSRAGSRPTNCTSYQRANEQPITVGSQALGLAPGCETGSAQTRTNHLPLDNVAHPCQIWVIRQTSCTGTTTNKLLKFDPINRVTSHPAARPLEFIAVLLQLKRGKCRSFSSIQGTTHCVKTLHSCTSLLESQLVVYSYSQYVICCTQRKRIKEERLGSFPPVKNGDFKCKTTDVLL
jgi:hypothetical protein